MKNIKLTDLLQERDRDCVDTPIPNKRDPFQSIEKIRRDSQAGKRLIGSEIIEENKDESSDGYAYRKRKVSLASTGEIETGDEKL
eukprot:UN19818